MALDMLKRMSKNQETELTDTYIVSLSSKIGAEWPLLGIQLGFSHAQLDQLQEAHPRNPSRCIRALLIEWRNVVVSRGGVGIPHTLSGALDTVGRCDLASDVRQDFDSADGLDDVDRVQKELPKYLEESLRAVRFHGGRVQDANMYIEQTKHCLKRFQKSGATFVETTACAFALSEFHNNMCITISGNAGDGKTTIGYYILSKMALEGFDVICVTNPELIEQQYNPTDRIVYFVDDAFGTPTLNNQLLDSWIRIHMKLNTFVKSGNFGLIVATRKQVLLAGEVMLDGLCCFQNVLDLTDTSNQLKETEKVRLLQNYCNNRNVLITDDMLNRSRQYSLSGFPLLCQLYVADSRLQQLDDFFEKPLALLRQHIHVLSKTDPIAFCGLVILMVYDGEVSTTVFDIFNASREEKLRINTIQEACGIETSVPLAKIEDALQPLIGVYIVFDDGQYRFIHDSIFDTVTLVFGEKYPKEVIKICTPEFLSRRVRAEDCLNDSSTFASKELNINVCTRAEPDVIYVPRRYYKDIAGRYVQDIMSGYIIEVFNNPTVTVTSVQAHMVKEIRGLSQHHLNIILRQKDRTSDRRLMHFVCKEGLISLAECLISLGIELNIDLMVATCEANQLAMIELLVKHGVDINDQSDRAGTGVVHMAAFNGNVHLLRKLVDLGAKVSVLNSMQIGPLSFACKNGKYDMAKFLVEQGVDVLAKDIFERCPIHYAATACSIDCVQLLTENGADPNVRDSVGCQPIHFAAEGEDSALLEYLLDKGCDPDATMTDGKRPLHCACRWDRVEAVRLLIKHGAGVLVKDVRGQQPLHVACETNSECINELLELDNIEINTGDREGMTPLHKACSHASMSGYKYVKLLVEMGADIRASDKTSMQPLTYACDHNATETAKFLISKDADINWRGFCGSQAIHFVVAENNTELTTLLVSKGAAINAKNQDSMKPIHFACKYGAAATLRQLLDLGVDPNERDIADYTPLFYACLNSHVDVVDILMSRGADPRCTDYLNRQAHEMIHLIGDKSDKIRALFDGIL